MANTTVKVKWLNHLKLEATTQNGHSLILDTSKENGGLDSGPRPMELLLTGLGGCMMMDMVSILTKRRLELKSMDMDITGERAEEHPRVYKKVTVTINTYGVPKEEVERAFNLSKDKYCSAYAMLSQAVDIDYLLNIQEA